MIQLKVECHAGYKGDERPTRFSMDNKALEIEVVEDQWYSPEARYFRVKADDGNIYVLCHSEAQDQWTLEAYRKE